MHTKRTKIFFAAWGVWLVYLLIRVATDSVWTKPGAAYIEYSATFGGAIVLSLGAWLAWRLYQRPSRSTAVWLIIICAILVWKFWVGGIIFFMHPSLGGYSFGDAVARWWSRSISGFGVALATFLPLLLIAASVIYWPGYCRKRRIEVIDSAA
jgi:hypothetical protein